MLVKKLLHRLNGLHYTQEYLCMGKENFQKPLYAYLLEDGKPVLDITNSHLFVGYCPLVFALSSTVLRGGQKDSIDIAFSHEAFPDSANIAKQNIIAFLTLKKIKEQAIGSNLFFYYEGKHGWHHFISGFHQYIIQLNNRLYNRKPGNVFLEENLYKQVQIAYSLPRKISLITVGQENLYNHFPTDLHGQIDDAFYVISLRHEGRACKQVESAIKIVLSDMRSSTYKQVYALGKNHMQPLKEKACFDFSHQVSRHFQLPLPKNLLCYRELELEDSFVHGIHRLLLFNIKHTEILADEPETLSHIHNVYATWRHKKGLPSNYLMR